MAKLSTEELLDAFKELTLIELSEFVKAFEETTYSLTVGATSDIVETDFGYHLIRRTD